MKVVLFFVRFVVLVSVCVFFSLSGLYFVTFMWSWEHSTLSWLILYRNTWIFSFSQSFSAAKQRVVKVFTLEIFCWKLSWFVSSFFSFIPVGPVQDLLERTLSWKRLNFYLIPCILQPYTKPCLAASPFCLSYYCKGICFWIH